MLANIFNFFGFIELCKKDSPDFSENFKLISLREDGGLDIFREPCSIPFISISSDRLALFVSMDMLGLLGVISLLFMYSII